MVDHSDKKQKIHPNQIVPGQMTMHSESEINATTDQNQKVLASAVQGGNTNQNQREISAAEQFMRTQVPGAAVTEPDPAIFET